MLFICQQTPFGTTFTLYSVDKLKQMPCGEYTIVEENCISYDVTIYEINNELNLPFKFIFIQNCVTKSALILEIPLVRVIKNI